MSPRLSGQTSIFGVVFFVSKSLLGIERQEKLENFPILTRKWPIDARFFSKWSEINKNRGSFILIEVAAMAAM